MLYIALLRRYLLYIATMSTHTFVIKMSWYTTFAIYCYRVIKFESLKTIVMICRYLRSCKHLSRTMETVQCYVWKTWLTKGTGPLDISVSCAIEYLNYLRLVLELSQFGTWTVSVWYLNCLSLVLELPQFGTWTVLGWYLNCFRLVLKLFQFVLELFQVGA